MTPNLHTPTFLHTPAPSTLMLLRTSTPAKAQQGVGVDTTGASGDRQGSKNRGGCSRREESLHKHMSFKDSAKCVLRSSAGLKTLLAASKMETRHLSPQLLQDCSTSLVRVRVRQSSGGGREVGGREGGGDNGIGRGGGEGTGEKESGKEIRVYSMQVFEIVQDTCRLKLLKELHTLLLCRDKAILELEEAVLIPPLPAGTSVGRGAGGDGAHSHGPGPWVALIKEPFLGTLREVCDGRPLPQELVSVLMRQMLQGVRFLHSHLGVQHNDLTTNTVVLTSNGSVKLASLGLCCAAREHTRSDDPELNPRLYDCDPTFAAPERLLRQNALFLSPIRSPTPDEDNDRDKERDDVAGTPCMVASSIQHLPNTHTHTHTHTHNSNTHTPSRDVDQRSHTHTRTHTHQRSPSPGGQPLVHAVGGFEEGGMGGVEIEQHKIAQRLVLLNLPLGLLKASGYMGTSRPAHLPPTSTHTTLFLSDCLQKMPQNRRHCGTLLESNFITTYNSLPPSTSLDWIRNPFLSLSPLAENDTPRANADATATPAATAAASATASTAATATSNAAASAYTTEEGLLTEEEGGGKGMPLSAAKIRRKKGDALVHGVQEIVKKSLVTEEETWFLQKVFNFIDKDGDGSLQKEEVLEILEYLGERKSALRDQEAVEHFVKRMNLDVENSEGLSFEQFMQWWTVMDYWNMIGIQKESKETALLRVSFNAYDDDGSGFIDLTELQNLLKDLGHEYSSGELKRMMKLICDEEDAEGLNFEQFTSLTIRLPYW
eukprot:CAMPEP_0179427786 /NCGR_PEP_ID=MMETSP0799-20121207/13629_1 /TAXON_ID=46947 /ORGANISM="Geminigera cryophila, Strain CCMP2564" /LENGTH=769 /DNA_ID=CAMNT_0021202971 /DNA_START=442 /DNA_END=2749 /DNA_ORIENTATION=-